MLPTPAQALWNQRHTLHALGSRLRNMADTVGLAIDLSLNQWTQITAYTLEFQPDLILELGRGHGNSTCCFLEAAWHVRHLRKTRIVSLDVVDDWGNRTLPRLQKMLPAEWFAPATIVLGNILEYDFVSALAGAKRILLFWDAHGFDIAECVLGHLLPLIGDRPHLVLMHDLSDRQYDGEPPREYGTESLWKGDRGCDGSFWIGNIISHVPQAISVLDFTTRNRIPLHSAGESLHREIKSNPQHLAELERLLELICFP